MAGEATRWKPGQSGNRDGRSKAAALVSRMVRERTGDGSTIVEAVVSIAAGTHPTIKSERSRLWALDWLSDRAFGRAVTPVAVDLDIGTRPEGLPVDYSVLTDAEAEAYELITAKLMESQQRNEVGPDMSDHFAAL